MQSRPLIMGRAEMKILEEVWNGNILPSERNIGVGSKM